MMMLGRVESLDTLPMDTRVNRPMEYHWLNEAGMAARVFEDTREGLHNGSNKRDGWCKSGKRGLFGVPSTLQPGARAILRV
jgi:hypothetical protein